MAGGLYDVARAAEKVADAKLKLPAMPGAFAKADKEVAAKKEKFEAARDTLKAAIQDLHKSVFGLAQEIENWGALVEKSDLGLDTKAKDFKKTRAEVQKLFGKWFAEQETTMIKNAERVNELAKHLADMQAYKSPPSID